MRIFMKDRVVIIKKKKINIFAVVVLTALLVVFFLNYVVRFYIPYIQMKCSSKANIILNSIINESVRKELENISYENLVNVSYNNEGEVKAILCDTVKMGIIKQNISGNIINELKKDNSFYITVPLVYISSNPLMSNAGPKVKVKVSPSGEVNVDFNDSFTSSGINQTKHEINIVIKVGCYTYLSGLNSQTTVTTTIPAVHNIIVGNVPGTYTNVESDPESVRDDVLNMQ